MVLPAELLALAVTSRTACVDATHANVKRSDRTFKHPRNVSTELLFAVRKITFVQLISHEEDDMMTFIICEIIWIRLPRRLFPGATMRLHCAGAHYIAHQNMMQLYN